MHTAHHTRMRDFFRSHLRSDDKAGEVVGRRHEAKAGGAAAPSSARVAPEVVHSNSHGFHRFLAAADVEALRRESDAALALAAPLAGKHLVDLLRAAGKTGFEEPLGGRPLKTTSVRLPHRLLVYFRGEAADLPEDQEGLLQVSFEGEAAASERRHLRLPRGETMSARAESLGRALGTFASQMRSPHETFVLLVHAPPGSTAEEEEMLMQVATSACTTFGLAYPPRRLTAASWAEVAAVLAQEAEEARIPAEDLADYAEEMRMEKMEGTRRLHGLRVSASIADMVTEDNAARAMLLQEGRHLQVHPPFLRALVEGRGSAAFLAEAGLYATHCARLIQGTPMFSPVTQGVFGAPGIHVGYIVSEGLRLAYPQGHWLVFRAEREGVPAAELAASLAAFRPASVDQGPDWQWLHSE